MHQFFTCWEETKRVAKSISASNRENYYYSAHDEDVFLGSPIHIFDKVEVCFPYCIAFQCWFGAICDLVPICFV